MSELTTTRLARIVINIIENHRNKDDAVDEILEVLKNEYNDEVFLELLPYVDQHGHYAVQDEDDEDDPDDRYDPADLDTRKQAELLYELMIEMGSNRLSKLWNDIDYDNNGGRSIRMNESKSSGRISDLLDLCKNAWKIAHFLDKIGTSTANAEIKKLLRPYSPEDVELLVNYFATYRDQKFRIDFDDDDATQYAHGVMVIMADATQHHMIAVFGYDWNTALSDHADNVLHDNYDNVSNSIRMNR